MIRRYYVPVSNTLVMGHPGYQLVYGRSPEDATLYAESLGYLVSGTVVEFPAS